MNSYDVTSHKFMIDDPTIITLLLYSSLPSMITPLAFQQNYYSLCYEQQKQNCIDVCFQTNLPLNPPLDQSNPPTDQPTSAKESANQQTHT